MNQNNGSPENRKEDTMGKEREFGPLPDKELWRLWLSNFVGGVDDIPHHWAKSMERMGKATSEHLQSFILRTGERKLLVVGAAMKRVIRTVAEATCETV